MLHQGMMISTFATSRLIYISVKARCQLDTTKIYKEIDI